LLSAAYIPKLFLRYNAAMPSSDRNFDDLIDRFSQNIYGNVRGQVRLEVLWTHLLEQLPQIQSGIESGKPLRVLDAGAGMGQISTRLIELGHEVFLNDLSENMITRARAEVSQLNCRIPAQFHHGPVQSLSVDEIGQFDLVMFHAVLEWLAEPQDTLLHLLKFVKPGGHLSLMFYNRDALIFRNLVRGNWRKVESGVLRGDEGGLTPYHPLGPEEVEAWLTDQRMTIVARAGVRVIYDYMERALRESRPIEEIVRLEWQYAQKEPYLHMGRYIHLFARA